MMKYFLIILLIKGSLVYSQTKIYFDQKAPSDTPEIFAPGIISDQYGNRDMAISPAGDELFYTLQYGRGFISALLYSQKINGEWTPPEVASFSGLYNDLEPAFSADGSMLYFVSNRPLSQSGNKKDYDIWYVIKEKGNWQHAVNAGAVINQERMNFILPLQKPGIFILHVLLMAGRRIYSCANLSMEHILLQKL